MSARKNDIMPSYEHNRIDDSSGQKVNISSVLADSLRDVEYVGKGTSAEKGGEVPPESVRSMFNRLNNDAETCLLLYEIRANMSTALVRNWCQLPLGICCPISKSVRLWACLEGVDGGLPLLI